MRTEPERAVRIETDGVGLEGDLSIPEGALALVLFAHGSGSSRFSPRNRYVARQLNKRRLATLLLDLLTPDAGHLFEEPGALDEVARLGRDWFLSHLVPAAQPA